jgi:hypothetical protein
LLIVFEHHGIYFVFFDFVEHLQGCHLLTLEKQKMTHKKQKTTEALSSKSRKKAESFILIANYRLNFVSM